MTASHRLVLTSKHAELVLGVPDAPAVWRLDLLRGRLAKAAAAELAERFSPTGDRASHSMLEPNAVGATRAAAPSVGVVAAEGRAEAGLFTDDEHEYFLSKSSLVGIVRIKRGTDGAWKASMAKTLVPRVLSKEAVDAGLMPPPGKSALPSSLKAVVPEFLAYWKARGDEARKMRDALVESGFFAEDVVKVVDGELSKVEAKFFLYDPAEDAGLPSLSEKVASLLAAAGDREIETFADTPDEALVEEVTARDGTRKLHALLDAPGRSSTPRELAAIVRTLKGAWLIEHRDDAAARSAFAQVGPIFKLADDDRLFCSSFAPPTSTIPVAAPARIAKRAATFQGIKLFIDRPAGFTQKGTNDDGDEWTRTYAVDYGYILGTEGGDDEELDVFLGPDPAADVAYVATQRKQDGSFDEYKMFLGFESSGAALDCYAQHIPRVYLADLHALPIGQVKALLGLHPLTKSIGAAVAVAKSELGFDPLEALADIGPPNEWSGAVAGALGAERRKAMQETWNALSPAEKTRVQRQFEANFDSTFKVAKALGGEEERFVLGVVLEPDVVDAQNDTYSEAEVRQAAHRFMQKRGVIGLMHRESVDDKVRILESYVAPTDFAVGDFTVRKGTWLMAVRVLDDALWSKVKQDGLTGFSIGGSAVREPDASGA